MQTPRRGGSQCEALNSAEAVQGGSRSGVGHGSGSLLEEGRHGRHDALESSPSQTSESRAPPPPPILHSPGFCCLFRAVCFTLFSLLIQCSTNRSFSVSDLFCARRGGDNAAGLNDFDLLLPPLRVSGDSPRFRPRLPAESTLNRRSPETDTPQYDT